MIPSNGPETVDDLFERELEDYQRALENGATAQASPPIGSTLPPHLRTRLNRAQFCLELLHQAAKERNKPAPRAEPKVPPPPLSVARHPETVGRFRITAVLGSGGFGIVYRALDPVAQREVALKVPRIEVLASPDLLRRFAQEAQAAAKLDHPNIVAMLEAGSVGLLPYIASAYYPGVTLAQWLREHQGPIEPRTAAKVVHALAQAVRHAHERGVLHRDIKPSNVQLAYADEQSAARVALADFTPKLMDFGLAKLAEASADVTQSGAVIGTVRYMAPEQAEGRGKDITLATDVYSLGVVLYEVLTGKFPFSGETDLALMHQILNAPPTSIRKHRPDVPADLETICLKCLEKAPARRYALAADLAEDLRRFLAGEPILARPATPLSRLVKWTRRRPALAGLLSVSALGLVLLLAVSLWYNTRLSRSLAATMASEKLASDRLLVARQQAYAGDMRLIDSSWNKVPYPQLKAILDRQVPPAGERDLRGFEWWFYANHLAMDYPRRLIGRHEGGVNAVAIAPAGDRAASAGNDGIIKLWRVADWALVAELSDHAPNCVNDLAFSPDGRLLASAANDPVIRLWNVARQERLQALEGHGEWSSTVLFSPDGRTLATAGSDKRIVLWDVRPEATTTPVTKRLELVGHSDTVRSVNFDLSRPLLYSAAEDKTIRVWDLPTGMPSPRLPNGQFTNPSSRWCKKLKVEPDGNTLVGLFFGDSPAVWHLREDIFGEPRASESNLGNARSLTFVPIVNETPRFLQGFRESVVRISDYPRWKRVERTLLGHSGSVETLSITSDARWLLSGDAFGDLLSWDLSRKPVVIREILRAERPFAVHALSLTGDLAAAVTDKGDLLLADSASGEMLRSWEYPAALGAHLAFTRDETLLMALGEDGYLSAFDIGSSQEPRRVRVTGAGRCIAVSPAGREVAVGGDEEVVILDSATLAARHSIAAPGFNRRIVYLDERTILVASGTSRLYRCDTQSATREREYLLPNPDIGAVAANPKRNLAAVGGFQAVYILDLASGAVLQTLPHFGDCGPLAFLASGRTLISSDSDNRVHVWHTATWQDVSSFDNFRLGNRFATSADGWRLLFAEGVDLYFVDARPRSP